MSPVKSLADVERNSVKEAISIRLLYSPCAMQQQTPLSTMPFGHTAKPGFSAMNVVRTFDQLLSLPCKSTLGA
jgi:hypothetical protein